MTEAEKHLAGLRKDINYQIRYIRRDINNWRIRSGKSPRYTAESIESILLDILARNGGKG